MEYSIRPFCKEDIYTVLEWRNSERIRKNMYNEYLISIDEHKKWFSGILGSDTESYLMLLIHNIPTGIVCFNKINSTNKHCFWGCYIGDPTAPRGSGTLLGLLGLDYAFKTFPLIKINGEALGTNKESMNFQERLGFVKEGEFEQHILKDKEFVSVIRYALFKSSWEIQRPAVISYLQNKGYQIK